MVTFHEVPFVLQYWKGWENSIRIFFFFVSIIWEERCNLSLNEQLFILFYFLQLFSWSLSSSWSLTCFEADLKWHRTSLNANLSISDLIDLKLYNPNAGVFCWFCFASFQAKMCILFLYVYIYINGMVVVCMSQHRVLWFGGLCT